MAIGQPELPGLFKPGEDKKRALGQFFTPPGIARFMAGLFDLERGSPVRLLDAGAGVGSLSVAFLERWRDNQPSDATLEVSAYELDGSLRGELERTLASHAQSPGVSWRVMPCDFVEDAVTALQFRPDDRFTHAILNPPYRKIDSHSRYRALLRAAGIETVNLYTAFVALSVELLAVGGQLVAIIPRSFCNGPYYRPFRQFLATRVAIKHLHLFHTRDRAFSDDGVLQENVILGLERGGKQGDVTISTSSDGDFDDYRAFQQPYSSVMLPDDPERFIRIPTSEAPALLDSAGRLGASLVSLGVEVSTGPVVDFRVSEYLRQMPDSETVPLLYPAHFSTGSVRWPVEGLRKPNALLRNAVTERWLYPTGFYTVVRRFSSKEERRRITASVVSPSAFRADRLAFENHLNVFHRAKHPLPQELAHGLALYLNSTLVDEYFRRYSGHTQVNATDLRRLRYPSAEALSKLGEVSLRAAAPMSQGEVDSEVRSIA